MSVLALTAGSSLFLLSPDSLLILLLLPCSNFFLLSLVFLLNLALTLSLSLFLKSDLLFHGFAFLFLLLPQCCIVFELLSLFFLSPLLFFFLLLNHLIDLSLLLSGINGRCRLRLISACLIISTSTSCIRLWCRFWNLCLLLQRVSLSRWQQ